MHKHTLNNNFVVIAIAVAITGIVAGIALVAQDSDDSIKVSNDKNIADASDNSYDPRRPREWIMSGPFQIDRSQYILGENILIQVNDLRPHDKGQMTFLRPLNDTHYSVYKTIPFDGAKTSFNQYFAPKLSAASGICSTDDLVGDWRLEFKGTQYKEIDFSVTDKGIVPGSEDDYEPVC